jgi:ribosomal protein S18 acetylase RimI-like enzyme
LSVCFKYGEAHACLNKEGVSTWLPPGKAPFSIWQIIRSVPFSVLLQFGRQGAAQLQAYGRYEDHLHRKLVPYPHWYLQMLGVDPKYQGQGYSRQLVEPMLERIDRENLPCYLETSNRKNVSIYRRFGFELISEDIVPNTELTNFAMLRKQSK